MRYSRRSFRGQDGAGIGPQVPEALQARLHTVRERSGETVPGSGAEQGANEIRLARGARR